MSGYHEQFTKEEVLRMSPLLNHLLDADKGAVSQMSWFEETQKKIDDVNLNIIEKAGKDWYLKTFAPLVIFAENFQIFREDIETSKPRLLFNLLYGIGWQIGDIIALEAIKLEVTEHFESFDVFDHLLLKDPNGKAITQKIVSGFLMAGASPGMLDQVGRLRTFSDFINGIPIEDDRDT